MSFADWARKRGALGAIALLAAIVLTLGPLSISAVRLYAATQSVPGQMDVLPQRPEDMAEFNRTFQEVFGPVPAVAATPFFALAVISGAALLTDAASSAGYGGPLIESIRQNRLIAEARRYSNWALFGALVLLTVIGYLANSGKLQGVFGKAFRAVEGTSVGMSYLMLGLSTLAAAPAAGSSLQHGDVMAASVVPSLAGGFALGAALLIVLSATMVVRFALDLLIWINPVPFIDLFFETAKKVFTVGFMVLYFVSPVAALIGSALTVVVSMLLLPWALRLTRFAYRIVLNPLIAYFLPVLKPQLLDQRVIRRAGSGAADSTVAITAVALKARSARKREYVGVCQTDRGPLLIRPRRLGRAEVTGLCRPGEVLLLGRCLAWIEFRVVDAELRTLDRFAISRALSASYNELVTSFGAEDAGDFGSLKVLRQMSTATAGAVRSASTMAREVAESAHSRVPRKQTPP